MNQPLILYLLMLPFLYGLTYVFIRNQQSTRLDAAVDAIFLTGLLFIFFPVFVFNISLKIDGNADGAALIALGWIVLIAGVILRRNSLLLRTQSTQMKRLTPHQPTKRLHGSLFAYPPAELFQKALHLVGRYLEGTDICRAEVTLSYLSKGENSASDLSKLATTAWDKKSASVGGDLAVSIGGVLLIIYERSALLISPWSGTHECWRIDFSRLSVTPTVPRVLFNTGFALRRAASKSTDRSPIQWGKKAINAHFERCPHDAWNAALSFRVHGWAALEAMHGVRGFNTFLKTSLVKHGGNGFEAVWCLAKVSLLPKQARLSLARQMIELPLFDLIHEVSGMRFDSSILKATAKCRDCLMTHDGLNELYSAMLEPPFRHVLGQLTEISDITFDYLDILPDWLHTPHFIELLTQDGTAPERVDNALDREILHCSAQDRKALLQAIKATEAPERALEPFRNFVNRKQLSRPFPPPPIQGDKYLVPIRTPQELASEGVEMSHCVENYIGDV